MEIDELFGLPAHPLLVHGAVVLLPLAALLVVVAALAPRSRRVGAPLALATAFVSLVFVGLAQGSGERLEDRVEETELVEEHTEEGERVLPWAVGLTIVAGALTVISMRSDKNPAFASKGLAAAVAATSLFAAAGATYSVITVGHSGATASWSDLPAASPDDEHESDQSDDDDPVDDDESDGD